MKEFLIIIVILAIIIGGDFFIENYLKNTSHELIDELKDLRKEIKVSKEAPNVNNLKDKANKIYEKWEKMEEDWAVIVLHSELDLIETSFTRMKSGVEEGELNRSLEEIETNIFLINHITEKEKFCLKNVL